MIGANGQQVELLNIGSNPPVEVDVEIAGLVRALNDGGIATRASCSGHGTRLGSIVLWDGRVLAIAKDLDEWRKVNAQVDRSPEGQDPAEGLDRNDESAVGSEASDAHLASAWLRCDDAARGSASRLWRSGMSHSLQLVTEAIRGRDAAWLVELMHDYDQIPGGQFKNKYPEFVRCVEVSPFMGSESTLMTLLKMAAGIHYAQGIDAHQGQDGETRLDPKDESPVVASGDDAP